MTEDNSNNVRANIIKADLTLTLQQKKLAFFFPENQIFIGQLKVLDIRLSQEGTDKIAADYTLLEEKDIRRRLLPRDPFAHKGKMGNALIITPRCNYLTMQISVPEAVIQFDREETTFSEAVDTEDFNAVGIGPGLGTSEQTAIAIIAWKYIAPTVTSGCQRPVTWRSACRPTSC